MSTASDFPDLPAGQNQPSLPGGQYVGWGAAFYGASAQQIHIHTSLPPMAKLRAPTGSSPRCDSRLFKVLVQLEDLIGWLVVLAEHSHTAVDQLAALFQRGEAMPTSSRRYSFDAPGAERPRRNA